MLHGEIERPAVIEEMRQRQFHAAEVGFGSRGARFHAECQPAGQQVSPLVLGTHGEARSRRDLAERHSEAPGLSRQKPVGKTILRPDDAAFRFGRRLGRQGSLLFVSGRLQEVPPQLGIQNPRDAEKEYRNEYPDCSAHKAHPWECVCNLQSAWESRFCLEQTNYGV